MDLSSLVSGLSEGHLTAGGGIIMAIVIVLGVIRGIMRVVLGIVGFIAAALAFWFALRYGDTILSKFTDNHDAWMPLGLAGGISVAVYTIVRHGAGFIFKPLIGSIDEIKKHRVISGIAGLVLGGAGLYGGGSASHQFDAMNFLNNTNKEQDGGWVSILLNKTQESWFGDFQQSTDPTRTGYRCDLIKALSLYTTGQSDKYNHPTLAPLIATYDFKVLASKPEISDGLNQNDFQSLFQHPGVKDFINNKDHRKVLDAIEWQKVPQ